MKHLIIILQLFSINCISQNIVVTVSDTVTLNVTSIDLELTFYKLSPNSQTNRPKEVMTIAAFKNYMDSKETQYEEIDIEGNLRSTYGLGRSQEIVQTYLLKAADRAFYKELMTELQKKYYLNYKVVNYNIENEEEQKSQLLKALIIKATNKATLVSKSIDKKPGEIKEIKLLHLGRPDKKYARELRHEFKSQYLSAGYEVTFESN